MILRSHGGVHSRSYYRGLERKVMDVLGTDESSLPRPAIEWLYHSFRCRAWNGKVDSIADRYGSAGMPYLERSITQHASALPLRCKNHGAYEAELIRRVDGRLAGYPSIYGYDFSGPPPISGRLSDYLTYLRPPWLRRYTYRTGIFDGRAIGLAIWRDTEMRCFPAGSPLGRLFRVDRVADRCTCAESFARICASPIRRVKSISYEGLRALAMCSQSPSRRPLRLLTFTTLFPNSEYPNHGGFVENRLRHLVATRQVESVVVAPVPYFPSTARQFGDWARYARVESQEVRQGLVVHHPRFPVIPRVGMSIAPVLLATATIGVVRRLLANGPGFDVIDAHYFYPDGVSALWIGRRLRRPVVITARGTDINLILDMPYPAA
jgi:hypothetical protein